MSALFLETANGLLAPAIGRRHSFREFLLQKPGGSTRGLRLADYSPNEESLSLSDTWRLPDEKFSDTHGRSHAVPSWSPNLEGFDLLFCDSLSYEVVKHPRGVKYRLISEKSLAEIENIAKAMLRPKR